MERMPATVAPVLRVVSDPDADLVEAWRRGDEGAFPEIVRRHQRALFALVRRYLKNEDDSQDVVQLTFVRAFRALGDFRGGSQLRTWLYRIAVNVALNKLRDSKAQRTERLDEEVYEAGADGGPGALEGLLSAESSARLKLAVEELPPKQRLVLELRVFHDLPFKEVATIAECTENTAKVNFHHAVKRLREVMKRGKP
jgi:RNA polymerase sigma-70 factor (ECF subfamily)